MLNYYHPDSTRFGKSGQLPVFVNKILLNTAMLICLHVCGCFDAMVTELSGCDKTT